MARHGPIFGHNEAYRLRKLFKHLRGPPGPIIVPHPNNKKDATINNSGAIPAQRDLQPRTAFSSHLDREHVWRGSGHPHVLNCGAHLFGGVRVRSAFYGTNGPASADRSEGRGPP